jgi:SAM-dependent methyltransferase
MTRVWATGDYPAFADRLIGGLGEILVEHAGIRAGERVLDVGAGAGNASLPAAARGADVTASDITPELLAEAARRAAAAGLELRVQEADAQALPFGDASFDVAMSCVGAIFAPTQADVASELARVLRPGGRLAMLNWRPTGRWGRFGEALRPFQPPHVTGSDPPEAWGDEAHVRGLFGDRLRDLRFTPGVWRFEGFADAHELLAFFRAVNGPLITLYERIGEDRAPELDAALLNAFGDPPFDSDYMLVAGVRPP